MFLGVCLDWTSHELFGHRLYPLMLDVTHSTAQNISVLLSCMNVCMWPTDDSNVVGDCSSYWFGAVCGPSPHHVHSLPNVPFATYTRNARCDLLSSGQW